jgi:hypothetical protein
MAERDGMRNPSERCEGFDDLFCGAKQYNAEATTADFLVELVFAGKQKLNPTLSAIYGKSISPIWGKASKSKTNGFSELAHSDFFKHNPK